MLEVAVRPKCDMDAENPIVEAAHPKCDMDAGKSDGNEMENDAVRPKRDMDAEKIVNVSDAARPKYDEEAGAGDEYAASKQQQKWYLKEMMKLQVKMQRLEGLLKKGEMLTERGEKHH